MSRQNAVLLPRSVRRAICAHAWRDRPRECCGLLVGQRAEVKFAIACTNRAAGTKRYRLDSRQHLDLRRTLRSCSPPLDIVGVYHSHPSGAPVPSPTDINEAYYPEWVHVIVGLRGKIAVLRAYGIRDNEAWPITIKTGAR